MDHKAYIRRVSGAKTAILFVHGIVGTPDHFDAFVGLVPETWSVFNILLDGHGGEVEEFSYSRMKKWEAQVSRLTNALCDDYETVLICAHSMGTLFAIDAALARPDKVKELFLLGSPMYARPAPAAMKNSLAVIFDRVREDDPVAVATRGACSICLSRKLWKYIGWVPRYLELFAKIEKTRKKLPELRVKCTVYQSAHDELVSPRAYRFLREQKNVETHLLEDSCHFYYPEEDLKQLADAFSAMCVRYNKMGVR